MSSSGDCRDSVNTADGPGVKLGTKLRPLKKVNWQRREEVLLAGECGGVGHVRIMDRGRCLFQCQDSGNCDLLTVIFHSITNFAHDNEFYTGLYIDCAAETLEKFE
jgi:hypothetical protein